MMLRRWPLFAIVAGAASIGLAEPPVPVPTPAVVTSTMPPIVLPESPNTAFCVGEKLVFSLNYEFVKAGEATMEVMNGPRVNGRPTIYIESNAKSTGFVDTFFRVRDFNASTVDRESLAAVSFHQNLREGDYRVIRNTTFDYVK